MTPRRSPREIADELQRLAEGASHDRATLLHEVQVYQEELTVQNEALREMQSALEETRDRFIELYDFAPNGYLTLDRHGVIVQINLTGASWLGKSKQAVEGMPLATYINASHRAVAMDFLRRCRKHEAGSALSVEVDVRSKEGYRAVELICRPRTPTPRSARQFFVAMIDISEQKRLEKEREEAARARAALAARLMSIQEDERSRIARDLHDNIGQQMTALRLRLDALIGSVDANSSVQSRLNEALTLIEELDRSLDFIAAELRPMVLDLGFVSAIEQFVAEWSATFGIPATLEVREIGGLGLPRDAETHLYRIAQEALNNVYKHAHATAVNVRLGGKRDDLIFQIADNGCGFSEEHRAPDGKRGLGLVGMRERAALIGAKLDLQSSSKGGTAITLCLPNAMVRRKSK